MLSSVAEWLAGESIMPQPGVCDAPPWRQRDTVHAVCRGCGDQVALRLITYRLPAKPPRHRVAAWRELRRLGAAGLLQGTWAIPDGEPFEAGLIEAIGT